MIIVKKNTDDFDKLISSGLVVVDIFAPWCGPCKMLSPNIERVVKELNVDLVKVNSDDNMKIATKFKVMSVPTLLIFRDGKLVDTKTGYMEIDELKKWIGSNL
jgi:thioredoxin 1